MLLQHGTSRDIECVPIHDRQWSYEIRLNLGVTKLDKSRTPSFTAYDFYGTRSCSRRRLLPRESLNGLDLAGRFHPSARVDASGPVSGLALRLASCRRMSGNGAHRDRAGLHDVFDWAASCSGDRAGALGVGGWAVRNRCGRCRRSPARFARAAALRDAPAVGGEVTSLLPRVGGVVVRMGRRFRT
jgi:hypothetical protein